ncbi:MAG: DUF3784 domain-containing protein [Ruminococcus sp.]|nr:DUF3784 domain-containing protein [Ruminococcus sp.]
MNYELNKNYFKNKQSRVIPITFMILGLVFVLFGMFVKSNGQDATSLFVIGAVPLIVGIVWLVLAIKTVIPNDTEYDSSVNSGITDFQNKALNSLGLVDDEVQNDATVVFGGFSFDGVAKVKKGTDGLWRSNLYSKTMLYFAEEEIYFYTCIYNTLQPQNSEQTNVNFYRDIISVSTGTETKSISINPAMPQQSTTVSYTALKVTLTSGNIFTVSVPNNDPAVQKAINNMRKLLKEKKASMV